MNTHDERQWDGLETALALSAAGDVAIQEMDIDVKEEVPEEVLEFAAGALPLNAGGKLVVPYDFAGLREIPMRQIGRASCRERV